MVHSNINQQLKLNPYQDSKKGKGDRAQTSSQVQHVPSKTDKYGAWGSVYKNKQNFIDMHNC